MRRLLCALLYVSAFVPALLSAEGFRDPTTPLGRAAAGSDSSSTPLRLQAISSRGGQWSATINGSLVHENQIINDVTITSILEDRVIVTRGGKQTELRLYETIRRDPGP